MNDEQNNLKQDFILELMVFSPKYNAVTAEQLATQLSEDDIQEYLEKLRRINEATAEELADLEESNPEEYEKRIKEREEAEEEADNQFYSLLENEVDKETDEVDKEYTKAEEQIDKIATTAEEKIDSSIERAENLVSAFFDEVDAASDPAPTAEPQVTKPEMNLAEVQNELRQIVDEDEIQKTIPPPPAPTIDHAAEEKKSDNWQ